MDDLPKPAADETDGEDPETDSEEASGQEDPTSPPPARRRGLLLIGILAMVGVAAIAWGFRQASVRGDDADVAAAREIADRFGTAYLTFDAETVDDATTELLTLTTDRFAREFESARLPSVEALFADDGTSTKAEVTDIFTTAVDAGRVRALVVVDVEATGSEGSQRLVNLSFVLELVSNDGAWRVDAVAPLPFPEVVGGPDSSVGATSTTVPPESTSSMPPTSGPPTTAPG